MPHLEPSKPYPPKMTSQQTPYRRQASERPHFRPDFRPPPPLSPQSALVRLP